MYTDHDPWSTKQYVPARINCYQIIIITMCHGQGYLAVRSFLRTMQVI